MFLVVFGHTFASSVNDNIGKHFLYGFHMPLFLFLSGYLLTAERLRQRSIAQLTLHYSRRMLLQWAAVTVCFIAVAAEFGNRKWPKDIGDLVSDTVLLPYFHLWYVPVLFVALVVLWSLVRFPQPHLLIASLGIGGFVLFESPLGPPTNTIDHRYVGYFLWLAAGFLIRARGNGLPTGRTAGLLAATGGALWLAAFTVHGWTATVGLLLLNFGLFGFAPTSLEWLNRHGGSSSKAGRFVEWLAIAGRDSLWIYLLHPVVTIPIVRLCRDSSLLPLVQLPLALAIFVLSVAFLQRRRIDKARSDRLTT